MCLCQRMKTIPLTIGVPDHEIASRRQTTNGIAPHLKRLTSPKRPEPGGERKRRYRRSLGAADGSCACSHHGCCCCATAQSGSPRPRGSISALLFHNEKHAVERQQRQGGPNCKNAPVEHKKTIRFQRQQQDSLDIVGTAFILSPSSQ
jgi:hypothetical protein